MELGKCSRCGRKIMSYPYASSSDGRWCMECHMFLREVGKARQLLKKHEEYENARGATGGADSFRQTDN